MLCQKFDASSGKFLIQETMATAADQSNLTAIYFVSCYVFVFAVKLTMCLWCKGYERTCVVCLLYIRRYFSKQSC